MLDLKFVLNLQKLNKSISIYFYFLKIVAQGFNKNKIKLRGGDFFFF